MMELERRWYRAMLRIRLIEETIAAKYAEQEMRCPVHLSTGQEATPVGVCGALATEDYVMSAHRSHANYLAKGGDLRRMLAEIYGRATGCARGKGGSMHLVDRAVGYLGAAPIVASTIPMVVGAAWGSIMRGAPRVAAAFFGDGATEEGAFHESLNIAALKRLPVLFVCENNLYSVYSPLAVRQPPERDLCALARAQGVRAVQGDGNDVVEVSRLAADAVRRARAGEGPTLLELSTYRWREHCGPNFDNQAGYRSEDEFRAWQARCPLARLERRLQEVPALTSDEIAAWTAQIHAEIEAAFAFAKASPFPAPSELMEQVYA